MAISKKISISLALLALLLLTACARLAANQPEQQKPALEVKGQTVARSQSIIEDFEYPALVLSEQEAKIIAKTSGTVKQLNYKLGSSVKVGSLLLMIDDINQGGLSGGGLSSSQVRQARLAVEQAESNRRNLALTSAENLKSAQIAYDSAKITSEQARLNLKNRQASVSQAYGDADINASAAADTVADTSGAVITGINNLAAFDLSTTAESPYKNNLGVVDYQLSINAKNVFLATKDLYDKYQTANFYDVKTKVNEALKLISQTKQLTDLTKKYLDASLVGGSLTQTILSGFQTTLAGYQTQINAALTQINGAKQALENNVITSDTGLDALTKAFELAKEQEKNAQQALQAQSVNIKSMLDTANLQYRNALLNLQSIIDIHSVIAPISGKITQSFVSAGETVSAGELLATVSSGQAMKFQFYVDESVLKKIRQGQAAAIKNNQGKKIAGKITSLAGQADSLTKRFPVEVVPAEASADDFALGTIVNILISAEEKSGAGNIILPLSAIEIGQNGNAVFTIENGLAKKVPVEIIKISGENSEIKTSLPGSAIIIIDGNKLVQEGDSVKVVE